MNKSTVDQNNIGPPINWIIFSALKMWNKFWCNTKLFTFIYCYLKHFHLCDNKSIHSLFILYISSRLLFWLLKISAKSKRNLIAIAFESGKIAIKRALQKSKIAIAILRKLDSTIIISKILAVPILFWPTVC